MNPTRVSMQFIELFVELLNVRLGQRAHSATWPLAVLPQTEPLANMIDRETPVARLADKAQRADFLAVYCL
jgi:hypothetical protein